MEDPWSTLYARHAEGLRAFFRRRGLSEADAEDSTQDVFLRLYIALREGRFDESHARGWLFRTAGNVRADEFRRRKRTRRALAA